MSKRLIEWGKNLVILLLTASALYLLTMTCLRPASNSRGARWSCPPRPTPPGWR